MIRKLYASYTVISFFKVYSSVQTIISDYKDATALNGLLIRILQVNPSVRTSVVKIKFCLRRKISARVHIVPMSRGSEMGRFLGVFRAKMYNSIVAPSLGLLRSVPTDPDTKLLFLAPLPSCSDTRTFSSAFPRSRRSEAIFVQYTRARRSRAKRERVTNWDASLSAGPMVPCESLGPSGS